MHVCVKFNSYLSRSRSLSVCATMAPIAILYSTLHALLAACGGCVSAIVGNCIIRTCEI